MLFRSMRDACAHASAPTNNSTDLILYAMGRSPVTTKNALTTCTVTSCYIGLIRIGHSPFRQVASQHPAIDIDNAGAPLLRLQ